MSNTLLVPITLDVLLANNDLLGRDSFRRWEYQYRNLNSDYFQSPEPMGFDQDIRDETPAAGAFLHWTLPRALRSSRPGSSSDYPLVPNRWLVVRLCRTPADPTGSAKAWVVESDCPATGKDNTRASSFMVAEQVKASWAQSTDPNRRQATPIAVTRLDLEHLDADPTTATPADGTGAYIQPIGQAFDLSAPWQERADAPLFLTAVAPGNLEFSAYVPFNANVFSFYDDLDGVPDTATLSYQVIGWYSDPAQDIVATGPAGGTSSSAAVLQALNWTLAVPPADLQSLNLGTSLYAGLAWGLSWQKDAVAPAPDQLMAVEATDNMTVAVGNTSVDAFTALVGGQLALQGNAQNTIELLRAFHYDMLPLLNQVNGDALLASRIHQEWFSARAGGTRWTITADRVPAGAASDSASAVPTAAESAWLLQLNRDQQALDEALTELTRLQWDLSAAWWKTGYQSAYTQRVMSMNSTGTDYVEQAAALDATNPTSILARVLAQLAIVDGLLGQVPRPVPSPDGNAQQAFLQGVMQFVAGAGKGLEPGKVLKAVAQPRFWLPNNPSVLISGVEPSAIADADGSLPVRLLGPQQISTLTVEGTAVAGLGAAVPPLANLAAVPAGVASLYQELFLLDPANAPLIAAHAGLDAAKVAAAMQARDTATYASGQLPALLPAAWAQQWNPLYLEWEVTYTDVPYERVDATSGARTKNWHFNGTDYDLAPGLDAPGSSFATQTVSGRSVLSAHTRFTFGARLKAFVDQYGAAEADLQGLYDGIEKVDDWQFLGQELVHFNEWLTQRDARAFRKPTVETFQHNGNIVAFEKVMGYSDASRQPPYDTPPQSQGLVGSVPAVNIGGPSDFPFHGIRSGQAYFSHLVLYDKFGRQRKMILPGNTNGLFDADNFPLVRDAALVGGSQLTTAKCAFQLPPRLLQPARLDLLLVDCQATALPPSPAPDASPIGGWLIVNHLDQALLLFDPTGKSMGELRLAKLATTAQVQWSAPPHGSLASVAEIAQRAPQLGAFVAAAQGRAEADFLALLGAIDSTLWTTDPLGNRADQNLSVLVGRPLALVRVKAQFALAGSPLASCEWPPLLASAPADGVPAFTTLAFSIRFGDLASRQDGVIGYFEGDDYGHFNSVAPPLPAQQYVREIGQQPDGTDNYLALPFDGQTSQLLTLLVDPRADIHATTGILPVKTLTIPAPLVHQALANIELTFRVGPLLTRKTLATPAHAQTMSYPSISEKHGTWSWWEAEVPRAGAVPDTLPWQEYELTAATPTAAFSPGPATLRDGYLQFRTSLDSGKNDASAPVP